MASKRLFHGTNLAFEQFDQRFARARNDYYGGGIAYFTENEKVARGYAEARYVQYKGVRLVYDVTLSMNKTFDVDTIYTGKTLKNIINVDKKDVESFARGAGILDRWWLKDNNMDKYLVEAKLLDGTIELTGEQVFNGLSSNKMSQDKARDRLITVGYDSLRYNGGEQALSRSFGHHNVYIAYKANNIQILKKFW